MNNKITIISLLALWALSGCQSLQENRQEQREAIRKDLAAVEATLEQQVVDAAPPSEVMQQLLPDMNLPTGQPMSERFDVAVKNMPARSFFLNLMAGSRSNIVVSPEIKGSISLVLNDVSVDEVLNAVRDTYGYDYNKQAYGYHILPAQVQTRIYELDYLNIQRKGKSKTSVSSGQVTNAKRSSSNSSSSSSNSSSSNNTVNSSEIETTSDADLWSEITSMVQMIIGSKEDHRVVANPQANVLVVRAGSRELRAVESFLQVAQNSLHRQVLIEAKIIEVELNDGFEAGIDWSKTVNGHIDGRPGSVQIGQNKVTFDNTRTNTPFNGLGGVFSAVVNYGNFNAAINLLETQGEVNVLSSPRISTVNNQKAVIKVGQDEFFVTDFSSTSTTSGSGTTTVPDVTLTPFFSGIALDVTPQIAKNDEIILHIHPSVSEVKDQTKTITIGTDAVLLPLALSTIRESDSIVRAKSGQVVVIGGLMKSFKREINSKTPLLGDIPGLGALFTQQSSSFVKSELVILLKPKVVTIGTFGADLKRSSSRINQLLEN